MRPGVTTEDGIIGQPAPLEEAVALMPQQAGLPLWANDERSKVHHMPKEILRLPDGFLRMRVRANVWSSPSLWSSDGRLADLDVRMNGWEIARGCCPACSGGRDQEKSRFFVSLMAG